MMSTRKFLTEVTVLDTETTNLIAEQAEIVELASARFDDSNGWVIRDRLFNARQGIPPAASAKNNISPRMIQDQPYWDQCTKEIKDMLAWDKAKYFVAHNCSYDQAVLAAAWDRCGSADVASSHNQSDWICTWRLSKQILGHDFGDIEYGLNYLRYLLDLPVPDSHVSHRAGADTLMCALLLERLISIGVEKDLLSLDADLGSQLHALCWSTIQIAVWPFGKYRGVALTEIPDDYWVWALKNLPALNDAEAGYDRDLAENVRLLLEARLADAS
jgi:hypothetical protein